MEMDVVDVMMDFLLFILTAIHISAYILHMYHKTRIVLIIILAILIIVKNIPF